MTSEPDETSAYLEWLRIRAKNTVTSRLWWPCVESLAESLLELPTLNARAAREAIARGLP